MGQPDSSQLQGDLGALLLDRGLITPQQLEEAIRIQRLYEVSGRDPIPRLGEILVERGFVGERQVAEVLAVQNKIILYCPRCDIQVNVRTRPDAQGYKCSRCEGLLDKPSQVRNVRVVDSSIILISREPLPDDVREAARDPSRKFGKYVLLGEIGRGGVAIIHRGWDTYLNQYVALKFIKTETREEPPQPKHESRILELMKEARSAVRLRHPNIVTVYEVGKVDREFYIAMELLEGATLAELIRRARDQGKVSPFYDEPRRYLVLLRDVARAVHYAHTRPAPLVHCDLKPSNVFVTRAGRACVLDFGLARELKRDAGSADQEGVVRGTPAYMAPEQAAGRPEDIDARTDVYGLGGILYELLAGRPPFTGDLFQVLHKAVSSMPDRPSDVFAANGSRAGGKVFVPEVLERMCLRCLEKDRRQRYPSGKDLADDLDRVIRGEPLSRRTTRRNPPPVLPVRPPRAAEPGASVSGAGGRWSAAAAVAGIFAGLTLMVALAAYLAASWSPSERRTQVRLEELRDRVDGLLASLRVEEARDAWMRAAATVDAPSHRGWIEGERVEVDWMDKLRNSLAAAADRTRPRLPVLQTRGGELRDVEVLKATDRMLVLFHDGRVFEAPWNAIPPEQIHGLAEVLLGPSAPPGDRFGLGLFCLKNRMTPEARAIFESLLGTDLGPFARKYLARLGEAGN